MEGAGSNSYNIRNPTLATSKKNMNAKDSDIQFEDEKFPVQY